MTQVPVSEQTEARFQHAVALHRAGKLPEAERVYGDLLLDDPTHADALQMLGLLALQTGRIERGVGYLERSLQVNPSQPLPLANLAVGLMTLDRMDEALRSVDRAIELQPELALAHNNRGTVLSRLGRHQEALASFDRALELTPDYVAAKTNRGNACVQLQRVEEALDTYARVLQLDPLHADTLFNLGTNLANLGRHPEAISYLKRLMDLQPGRSFVPGSIMHAQLHCCDWVDFDRRRTQIIESVTTGGVPITPFGFLAVSGSAPEQLRCARNYVAIKCPPARSPVWDGKRYGHEKIRLAYLSADFHEHATTHLIAELFEKHDRDRFEISALSFGPDSAGPMRQRLLKSFDRFIDVRLRDNADIARMLRDSETDIAIDLKGFTTDSRPEIFAHRAAPLQVNYLGYPGSMGAPYIDYIVADQRVIPAEHRAHYAEKVIYLPDSYQPNDSTRAISSHVPTRAGAGLPPEGFVYCCFNNSYKITPDVFACWMRLLKATPGSVLWLLRSNAIAPANLEGEAGRRGVDPRRLIFAPALPPAEHLARHALADLFLDNVPINAHTTASDALWAGLPVLTCQGNAFAGRVAASLLHAVGLPELVTHSLVEYEGLALELAHSPDRLAALRSHLAQSGRTGPLFDSGRYRQNFEQALLAIHRRHEAGLAPGHVFVKPGQVKAPV